MTMQQAKFIVLEGIDGSGKSTQFEFLRSLLQQKGITAQYIHFPRLQVEPFGPLIDGFLRGTFGEISAVHPKLVALLYAQDRMDFSTTLQSWLDAGHFVIADRYVYSNIAFQCAKLRDPDSRTSLTEWILDLEYDYFRIPMPDYSLFLDVSSRSAQTAIAGDSTRDTPDIHESDISFQERVREEYLHLVHTRQDFERIACNADTGERYTPEHVHDKIVSCLSRQGLIAE